MTSSVSGTSSNNSTTSTSSSSSTTGTTSAATLQTNFMNLLVAQLQNQDPLNPMDSSQMTTQLAEINTVSGIQSLNSTLQTLLGSYNDSQSMQASSLVGHSVLSSGNTLNLTSGSTAVGGFSLPSSASTATVTVKNSSGQVVHTATLTNLSSGIQTFQWDGTTDSGSAAVSGNYTFSVSASNNGTAVTATPLQLSVVDGVNGGATSSSGTVLNTSNGQVQWSSVQQVY